MANIEVRPIEKKTWHGKTGKDSFSRPKTIEALVNSQTGLYSVDMDSKELEEISERTKYDLSLQHVQGKVHPFWGSAVGRIKLENKTNIFNTARDLDKLKVAVLKGSKLVANSMKEYKEGRFPEAMFVIFDEQEEVEAKATAVKQKNEALLAIAKLTTSRKLEMIHILTGMDYKNQSNDYIDVKASEVLDDRGPAAVNAFLKKDKKKTAVHSLVLRALEQNVLQKEGLSVLYMGESIGMDTESAVDYLMDTKNQQLKAVILDKLN